VLTRLDMLEAAARHSGSQSHPPAGTPSASSRHRAFIAAGTPSRLLCTSQATHCLSQSGATSRVLRRHRCAARSADSRPKHHHQAFLEASLLMICVAKVEPRYTAAAAHEHWHALAPRLPTPAQVSRPRCTRHDRCALRCASAASSSPALKVRCAKCSRANP
jgi:hypothetical protein